MIVEFYSLISTTKRILNLIVNLVISLTDPHVACVQSITDTHHGFAVDETDDMVEELCTILEVAMSHRLKATSRGSASFFRPETYSSVPSFWRMFSHTSCSNDYATILLNIV